MGKSTVSDETSWKETRFGILSRSKVIQLEVQGTQKGLLLLQKISEVSEPISPDLIKRMHKICFEDILQDRAGVFQQADEGDYQNLQDIISKALNESLTAVGI